MHLLSLTVLDDGKPYCASCFYAFDEANLAFIVAGGEQSAHVKAFLAEFTILSILLVVLTFRVGWVQIVKGGKYADMAKQEQKKDMPIEAKRGSIYDCHGQVLALSAVTNTI